MNYQLRITNYELPITNYQLPITNYQLSIINYQLSIMTCEALNIEKPSLRVRDERSNLIIYSTKTTDCHAFGSGGIAITSFFWADCFTAFAMTSFFLWLAIINYELRITNYKLRISSFKFQVSSFKLRIMNDELPITNYELRSTQP